MECCPSLPLDSCQLSKNPGILPTHMREEENQMDKSLYVKDSMVIDPAIQKEIIGRAIAGSFGDQPDRAIHSLGTINVPYSSSPVSVHLRHAVDAIMVDPFGHVVLITREFNPGAGLKAVPGGFIDPINGVGGESIVENALKALFREAGEETGASEQLLQGARIVPVGSRNYDRPFDVREAFRDMNGTDIRKGDLFAVSTQGFVIITPQNLAAAGLEAGSDAKALHIPLFADIKPPELGIADHYPMIRTAVKMAAEFRPA